MTPHMNALDGEIAKTVIITGDPKRVELFANHYLEKAKKVNDARGILAFTGNYKGKTITVMAHGMGMPSVGIYVHELYTAYQVDTIIRVGSCGAVSENLKLMDIVVAEQAYTESNYALVYSKENCHIEKANEEIVKCIETSALQNSIVYTKGTIATTDVFDHYVDYETMYERIFKETKVLAAEMEAFALFHIARKLQKKAACILTVVDSLHDKRAISVEEREQSLNKMFELALETIVQMNEK